MLKKFIHDPVNRQFVKEVSVNVLGQGLYDTYNVILVGNKHNRYVMDVEYLGKQGTITFEEKHITEWQIMTHPENGDLYDYFEFDGFGMLEGTYYTFHHKIHDFDHLYTNGIKFTITKVVVENNCSENDKDINRSHDDWINICYNEINKTRKEKLELYKNMKKIDYDSFIKESGNYSMISDFRVISFDKKRSYVSENVYYSDIIINGNTITMKHTKYLFDDDDIFKYTAHVEFNYTDSNGIPIYVHDYCDFIIGGL